MKRDDRRFLQGSVGASDPDDDRYVTRRRLLAAAVAAGMGLGAVGAYRGDDVSDWRRSPSGRGRTGTKTAGGHQQSDSREKRTEGTASTERDEDFQDPARDPTAESPVIGANLNGRPRLLANDLELIDASNTTWVRAFLDVREKIADGTPPEDDPDVLALREVAREWNCRLVVSLKWDFTARWRDKKSMRVPKPGSAYERELCRGAVQCLGGIDAPVDIVVLGNEPMWETHEEDIKVDDSPIVQFTRTVKDYLVQYGDHGDSTYLVGAFNRAHDETMREQEFPHFYRDMLDFVRDDDGVDGVDLHVHFDSFGQAERMLAVAREAVPDGTITATEFSPVWRYNRYKDEPIAGFEACAQFAADHDLPAGMTAVDYFEYAKRNPRPPEEVAALYDALPWYNVDHVEDMYGLFADYDVSVGTLGFVQSLGMRTEDWTRGWAPFHINFLFQPALIRTAGGTEHAANLHYLEDYRRRAVRG